MAPYKGRADLHSFPPGRGWTQAVGAPIPGEIAGLGQLGVVTFDRDLAPGAYAAGSLIGATVGGAIVGYVASASPQGATTGALFTGGLAALSDSVLFGKSGESVLAMTMLLAGVGGMGLALYRMSREMR
jgi:hypothetical protein